jgi:hypothetical protein
VNEAETKRNGDIYTYKFFLEREVKEGNHKLIVR